MGDKDIFNPLLYATFLPIDGAFTKAVLGYARSENSNDRHVVLSTIDGGTGGWSADHRPWIG